VANSVERWFAWLKQWFGLGRHTEPENEEPSGVGSTSPSEGLTPEQTRAVELARQIGKGDCEHSAEVLRQTLPGGIKRRFAGDRLFHEVYEHQGMVYDVTAKQYVRHGVWVPEELAEAGLIKAVELGVFTPEQHRVFMAKLNQSLGGVEE